MKKFFSILLLTVLVWSCSKKMAPAKTEIPSSNTGMSSSNTGNKNIDNTPPVQHTENNNPDLSSKSLPVPDPAKMSPAELSARAGQSTYNAKCGRCHGLKVVSDYTAPRWASIMQVMATKANLAEAEKANVLTYVQLNAKK